MAKNSGNGYRIGAVINRQQVFNPVTRLWTKQNLVTGQFMDGKQDGTPFKGVKKS